MHLVVLSQPIGVYCQGNIYAGTGTGRDIVVAVVLISTYGCWRRVASSSEHTRFEILQQDKEAQYENYAAMTALEHAIDLPLEVKRGMVSAVVAYG